jgi:hypothetical protein
VLQHGAKSTPLGFNRFSGFSQCVLETAEAIRMSRFASNTQLKQGVNQTCAGA